VSLLLAWIPYNLWLLIAPLVKWLQATGGEAEPARLVAHCGTLQWVSG
jgi:hypothetical protein